MHPKPTTFEIERDDLLAYYEASPVYRRRADYTPEAFDGRRRTYFHRLQELLDRYAAAYPHLRDALGLELSRPQRRATSLPGGLVSYEFDGLMLAERLERRVGRLHLLPNATLFSAFIEGPNYYSPVAQQQRFHFERAVKIAKDLAHAVTRELLTTEEVKLALLRLRAFGPLNYPLSNEVLGPTPSPEQAQWWERTGLLADRSYLQATTRSSHEAAYATYNHTQVAALSPLEAQELVSEAKQASLWPKGNAAFSPEFYARYFVHVALPAVHHSPETRVILGVAALYVSPCEALSPDQQKTWLHCLQKIVAEKPALANVFFEALDHTWHSYEKASDRLEKHLRLSRWLSRSAPSSITTFYEALGTHLDLEDDVSIAERIANVLKLARLVQPNRRLYPAHTELSALAADLCNGLYQQLDLRLAADQAALRDLFPLLAFSLDSGEIEVIEEILVEEVVTYEGESTQSSAEKWLEGEGLLAKRIRYRLRAQLLNFTLPFMSDRYQLLKNLLINFSTKDEFEENDQVMLSRYDIDYFIQTCDLLSFN
ncbi:hypothetical protein SAMN00120144_2111 [Hymenobacter roseosalivarius DSM 11622]|uniref:Uncharacterized protein n=1 Tax=Hymenobacter roseosalivarius DSM 11622 TaxID=645990 RepID=A0A1W1VG45_9BACT|nr:hypothetical protein [Hymenobacter roseosalivarius]SMB92183.1 hypothetical protein SAMN00120144_2111 [Hymenobacter roseosalivarius DSM 11622]